MKKNDTYTPLTNLHYIGGHPDIIISNYLNLEVRGGNIFISNAAGIGVGVIFNRNITNVWISNESTLHTEVTFWRVMFFGILAFFVPKTVESKVLNLIISWRDECFSYNTTFEFTSHKAWKQANAARNALIKELSE